MSTEEAKNLFRILGVDPQDQIKTFQEAIQKPNQEEIFYKIAQRYEKIGDREEALVWYRLAAEQHNPQDKDILKNELDI